MKKLVPLSQRFVTPAAMLAVTLLSASAAAQPTVEGRSTPEQAAKNLEEAKARYAQGLKLYEDGAHEAARVQFERAYELAPSPKILYNIGLVYKQLNDFVGSLKSLEKYLAEGGLDVPPERRPEVEKVIAELRAIVARATVTVNVPGAEIAVDDLPIGKAPLSAPILLNPGRRKISSKAPNRLPDAKVITVASGDDVKVDLNLVAPPQTTVIRTSNLAPIVAWSVTGVLAVGAGVTGYLTSRAQKSLDDERNNPAATRSSLDDSSSQLKTGALITDILIAGAVVSAGAAVYFTWFRKDDKPAEGTTASRSKRDVGLSVGPGSVLVQGKF